MKRYLGFNLPEWMWIVFFAYAAFLAGGINVSWNEMRGLGGFLGAVVTPLFFTLLLGVGPVLALRAGVRLVGRMNGEIDGTDER